MQKSLFSKISAMTLIIVCQITACNSPQSNISPTLESTGYYQDYLNGEKVLIPNGISKEVFSDSPVTMGNASARVASGQLSLKELVEISEPIVKKYPDLSQNPLKVEHLEMILHDFPDFDDEKTVREKSEVVLRYYNGLMKAGIKPEVEEALSKKRGGRPAQASFDQINALEWQHLNNNPTMISRYYYASTKAKSETLARFGSTLDGLRGNAFQHAIWNCLIIREAMYASYSKNNAILFTRNITSDHEYDATTLQRQYTSYTAMDLHNNLSARSYMGNVSSGSVWPFSVNVPSESDLFDAWYHASTTRNDHLCNPVTTIIPLYSWDFLYGEARGDMGDKLYFFLPALPGC